jgi:hypothetical protein
MLSGALLRPVETFAAILTDSRLLGRAVLFFIAVGMFSMACAELYRAVLPAPYNDPAGAMLSQFLETPPAEPSLVSLVATLTLAPFLLVVSLFAEGLVLHAALRIVGGGRSGIAATVKVVAYSGASLVLLAVPVIGAPLGWVASTVLTVIGAAKAHRTSYARAAAGVLLLVGLMALLLLAAYSLMSFAGGLDTDQTTTL